MNLPLRKEPWGPGPHQRRPCPVCGSGWWPWAGSFLPCHGRCLFTSEEQDALLDDPRTESKLAADIGVTVAVLRASLTAARKRRAHAR